MGDSGESFVQQAMEFRPAVDRFVVSRFAVSLIGHPVRQRSVRSVMVFERFQCVVRDLEIFVQLHADLPDLAILRFQSVPVCAGPQYI
jgi:hypothetical protein